MTFDQGILFTLLFGVFVFLIWGRWRYDLVAFVALMLALLTGIVPVSQAFSGFGHPATVIIALVLIVSRGLSNSGVIELIARYVVDASRKLAAHVSIMSALAAALSAIMNNVAALALLMPVDLQAAKKAGRSPSLSLMARRHDHVDRYTAEHRYRRIPQRLTWRAIQDVRFRPGRHCVRGRRRCLRGSHRLAPAAVGAQGGGRRRRVVRPRRLYR
jgi:hypothetical protein